MQGSVKDYLGDILPGENDFSTQSRRWDISTLVSATEGLETYEFDLMSLDLDSYPWNFKHWNFRSFLHHMSRMEKVDSSIPIIVTPYGYICDGWHRAAKAIMEGKNTIKAYRLKVMPEPDEILKSE
jgi:hypothetical protein